jgi:tetratricopeptide (TPR) repeat protein
MRLTILTPLIFSALLAQPQEARQELNLGVSAYKDARYPEAIEHFSNAAQLDPNFVAAHLYLGTAYMQQYIPGSESPDNQKMAQFALDAFRRALNLDAQNETAISSVASLYYQQKKFSESADWYKRATAVNPNNKEAWYTLGVIAWSQFYPAYAQARARLGMKPEDPGPLRDQAARQNLTTAYGAMIDEGLRNLEKALSLDPEYDDAMAYMNLLVRERADMDETQAEYQSDIKTADEWVRKALDTKKRKAERPRP